MDNKKKISETYKSDKDTRKERIVVGLNGGIDAFVTAYLLKIQKYDLIGVTVMNTFPTGNSEFLSCLITQPDVDKIKEFCHQLGIPHQTVKPVDEFKEEVIEPWISARIFGIMNTACQNCHQLRMKTLYQKMVSMDAKYLATGHYAKIFRHESLNTVFLHTANDEKHDQAPLLSGLPSEILNSLMLPLSDLQKKEVIKLADNFGFSHEKEDKSFGHCFNNTSELEAYLKKAIPNKMRQPGEIYLENEAQKVGAHEGMYQLNYGEVFDVPEIPPGSYFVTGYVPNQKKSLLNQESFFIKDKILLTECMIAHETHWNEPMKGAVIYADGTHADCWIYPKALKRALVVWEGLKKVKEGEIISIAKKPGKNAKIFVTGKIKFLKEKKVVEGEKNVQQIDYSRDF